MELVVLVVLNRAPIIQRVGYHLIYECSKLLIAQLELEPPLERTRHVSSSSAQWQSGLAEEHMQPSCWLMERSDAQWQEYGSHRSVPNAALTVGAAACGE